MTRRQRLQRRLTNATAAPALRLATADSAAVQRQRFANQHNITFKGLRRLNDALGYPEALTPNEYVSRYERGGIAKRIVEALPMSTWRGGGELVEDDDPDTETAFESAFDELNKRLKIWPTFQKADILAGLGEYAGILLGAPGKFDEPLERCRPEDLVYLTPFMQRDLTFGDLESDTSNIRFNMPLFYNLTLRGRKGNNTYTGGKIHHSRIVLVVDGSLDNPLLGTPRLRAVWNYLEDLDKVVGGGAEAFWKRADRGLHIKLDPEIEPDEAQVAELRESIQEYTHELKRVLTTRGVDVESLGSDVANFSPNAESICALISATIGIPQRILMGSERGELASSTDQSNYDDRVQDRRVSFADPDVVRPFVTRLQELGVLPEAEYEVRWPEIDDLTDDQKMQLALNAARINQAAGETVIEANEIRDRILGFPPLEHLEVDPNEEPEPPPPGNPAEDANETDVTVMSRKRSRLLKLQHNTKNW